MGKIKSWTVEHKVEFIILLAILLIGVFMRLYKISGYMTFLGDEGRDVIIVRRLLIEHHPPLIGPGTSIGNMYLGPAYYYMMAIPLMVANFSPVGPAVFIAILGIVTIFFVWWVVREWFPAYDEQTQWGALLAALLYAISPVIIIYSRSSWNPNIMPFFSLATVYFMWRVWQKNEIKSLVVVGASFAFVLQSHYLGLLLGPVLGILWVLSYLRVESKKKFIVYSIISSILFLALMSPLAIFDFRHNFINSKAIIAFFSDRQSTVSIVPWKAIPGIWPILTNITIDLVGAKEMLPGMVIALIVGLYFIYEYFFKKVQYDSKKVSIILVITLWLGFGLLGMALYKQHIYDHYFGFVFTVPFIILGELAQMVFTNKKFFLLKILFVIGFVIMVFVDFQNSPLLSVPNMQLQRAQFVAGKVIEFSNGQRFNFALIADSNYDSAYRYFLDLDKAKVVDIDLQNTKGTITDQLIVVCERVKEKCDPTHNPKTEVAAWGWSKIVNEWDNVYGVTIYKLGHVLH